IRRAVPSAQLGRIARVLPRLRGGESVSPLPRLRRVLPRLRGGESLSAPSPGFAGYSPDFAGESLFPPPPPSSPGASPDFAGESLFAPPPPAVLGRVPRLARQAYRQSRQGCRVRPQVPGPQAAHTIACDGELSVGPATLGPDEKGGAVRRRGERLPR